MSHLSSLSKERQLLPSSSSLVPYKILIHEDEDDKNQIRSHAYALAPFLIFRIPPSNFRIPDTLSPPCYTL